MKIPKFEPIRIEDFENLPLTGRDKLFPDGTLLLPIPEQSTLVQRLTNSSPGSPGTSGFEPDDDP